MKYNKRKQQCLEDTNRRYVNTAQYDGRLFTLKLQFGDKYRNDRRRYRTLVSRVFRHIVRNCITDNMKAPNANEAKSSLLSNASYNFYFGLDVAQTLDGNIVRTAYATGSGASSIGMDPRYAIIHPFTIEMLELRNMIQELVERHYKLNYHTGCLEYNCNFNHVSGKIYIGHMATGLHTDIEYNSDHSAPVANNSQETNTPVVIVSFGDEKYLQFVKFSGIGGGNPAITAKRITMRQESYSIILLDPKDEQLNGNSWWKHRAFMKNNASGVAGSLMFRVCRKKSTVTVSPDTNMVVNPHIPGGINGKKIKQFNRGWKSIIDRTTGGMKQEYLHKVKQQLDRVTSTFEKYYVN